MMAYHSKLKPPSWSRFVIVASWVWIFFVVPSVHTKFNDATVVDNCRCIHINVSNWSDADTYFVNYDALDETETEATLRLRADKNDAVAVIWLSDTIQFTAGRLHMIQVPLYERTFPGMFSFSSYILETFKDQCNNKKGDWMGIKIKINKLFGTITISNENDQILVEWRSLYKTFNVSYVKIGSVNSTKLQLAHQCYPDSSIDYPTMQKVETINICEKERKFTCRTNTHIFDQKSSELSESKNSQNDVTIKYENISQSNAVTKKQVDKVPSKIPSVETVKLNTKSGYFIIEIDLSQNKNSTQNTVIMKYKNTSQSNASLKKQVDKVPNVNKVKATKTKTMRSRGYLASAGYVSPNYLLSIVLILYFLYFQAY